MNTFCIFIFFMIFYSDIFCHIERDEFGLFDKVIGPNSGNRAYTLFENRPGRQEESLVFDIQNQEQFARLVIKNSFFKPVVLKIYSPLALDYDKGLPIFQNLADNFDGKVIFAGLDVSKNSDIFMQISMFYGLKKIQLPLFLFYQFGKVKMPFLAGFQPKNSLSSQIERFFFTSDNDPGH